MFEETAAARPATLDLQNCPLIARMRHNDALLGAGDQDRVPGGPGDHGQPLPGPGGGHGGVFSEAGGRRCQVNLSSRGKRQAENARNEAGGNIWYFVKTTIFRNFRF